MNKKYKLKCFFCGRKFDSKADVYRDDDNRAACSDCMIEFVIPDVLNLECDDENDLELILPSQKIHDFFKLFIEERCPKCDLYSWIKKGHILESCECGWNVDDYAEYIHIVGDKIIIERRNYTDILNLK